MASGVAEDNPQGHPTSQTTPAFSYCFDFLTVRVPEEWSAGVDRNGACQRSQQDQGADPAVLVDVHSPGTTDGGQCRDAAKVSVMPPKDYRIASRLRRIAAVGLSEIWHDLR
jgi:hypothetical protein